MWFNTLFHFFSKDIKKRTQQQVPVLLWGLGRRQKKLNWGIRVYLKTLRRFRRLSPFSQRLISNLMVGMALSLLLSLGGHLGLRSTFDVASFDWTMKMFLNTAPENPNIPPFLLLNIDETSYRQWNEPATLPRDKLLQLIQFAVAGQAKMIFVDVDLGYPNTLQSPKLTDTDKQFVDFFDNYETLCGADNRCPDILLARNTRQSLDEEGQVLANQYPNQRTSFLDTAVAKSPHLHWASVGFLLDKDNTLRRWQLWEAACKPNAVIPSVQLLAIALIKEQKAGADKVKAALEPFTPQDCDSNTPTLLQQTPELQNHVLTLGEQIDLHLTSSRLGSSIVYTIPEHLPDDQIRPEVETGDVIFESFSAQEEILSSIEGESPLTREYLADLAQGLVENKVVAIGATYANSRDIFYTPVGMMPGVFIIINAINSLLQYGELTKPPWWQVLFVEILLIILMSVIFARFCSFWGMIVAGICVIITVIPLSFWLFKYGIWLEFAIPLIIMQLYRMSQDFERKSS